MRPLCINTQRQNGGLHVIKRPTMMAISIVVTDYYRVVILRESAYINNNHLQLGPPSLYKG